MADLDRQAAAILEANDRGGFTVPTARLYPHQWNWDSAIAALGFAEFDLNRAWTEIETLFEGQWSCGMVPHIIFRRDDPDYFPGPEVWGSDRRPPTSGYSQPPLAATVVRALLDKDPTAGAARAKALFPSLLAWHRWFHRARDPEGRGVIAAVHPWESGRDNAPDWDAALAAVDPAGVSPYSRRDTTHVDPAVRPSGEDYDRYVKLIDWGRAAGWDQAKITREGPFAVADPGLTFVLARADRDLGALAGTLGETGALAEIAVWIERAVEGAARLWHEGLGAYTAWDLRRDLPAAGVSCAAFLAFYAGLAEPSRVPRLIETLDRSLAAQPFGLPSFDPAHPKFDARRYWRGPVWPVMNYLVGRGLEDAGLAVRAARLRGDIRRLVEASGFYEYFDPRDGRPAGGGEFTWTAAVWLAWASPSKR